METGRKHRGLMTKTKLGLPFYKAAKPRSPTGQYNAKTTSNQQAAAVGYVVHQEYIITHVKPKFSFFITDEGSGDDEAVDTEAANYIRSEQERFKHEWTSSEVMSCQDIVQ
ncbi:hypothetical protein SAY87_007241 [Trapa incisa]|uniref:Uncharacterized protein n=1 Tax=Trapa incisa TaxID=236973 RepID=A0AAN7Q0X1_9MYRT|nr:hypothetical protein SAY87_007241 [Trapa incisa]